MSTSAKRILDLGCGTGHQLLHEYRRGAHIIGLDLDQTNIDEAQKLMPNGTFAQADLLTIDLSTYTSIDEVRCTEVLEHIDDWQSVVKQLTTMQQGTSLLITVPHETSERKLLTIRPNYWKEIGHLHFFDGRKLVSALQDAGFHDIRVTRSNASLYFELRSLFRRNAPCIRNTYYEQVLPLPLQLFYQLFRPNLFETKLKWLFPLWMFTLPIGKILDVFLGASIRITAVKQ